jgi:hypothetical protein
MKPNDDFWLRDAHANAEHLDREIKKLTSLTAPIRSDLPIVTKYQDFWALAKSVSTLFRELKPLAKNDRDLLWNQFNALCREVKEYQKTGYGMLENLSQEHSDEIRKQVDLARLPEGVPAPGVPALIERGQALKNAADLLAKFKHEMIAKHKKISFERIQEVRRTHDAAWGTVTTEKPPQKMAFELRVRKNLAANYELYRKAASALENFQIGAAQLRSIIDSCGSTDEAARATVRLVATQARIRDIAEGMRKLETWIEKDERTLGGKQDPGFRT